MEIDYLMYLLDLWSQWMRTDDHGLGYPKKSTGISSGGAYTSFEDMFDSAELDKIRTVDSVVHSLDPEQQKAIYARYLRTVKPRFYELKLELAMDNLLTIVSRRLDS